MNALVKVAEFLAAANVGQIPRRSCSMGKMRERFDIILNVNQVLSAEERAT